MRDLLDIVHNIEAMGGGGTASSSTDKPVNQALESVLGMALQMPAIQALGKKLGVSLENGLGGGVNDVMDVPAAQGKTVTPDNEETKPFN
ncbi:MAG: hypothetical protein ABJL72_12765 [Roseobacter sp.]